MSYSRTAFTDAVDDSYEPTLKAASAKVLITEQEVLFGSAVALSGRRRHAGRRRYEFLERSLMAREMDRL